MSAHTTFGLNQLLSVPEITEEPLTSVVPGQLSTLEPTGELTFESYRSKSGGAIPPIYALVAAAIGAVFMVFMLALVSIGPFMIHV